MNLEMNNQPQRIIKGKFITYTLLICLTLLVVLGVLLLINKSNNSAKQHATSEAVQIEINKKSFSPSVIVIKKGTQVTWINKDMRPHHIASNPHPEHDGLPGLDSKDIIGIDGGSYSFRFENSGEYTYHDHLNPVINGKIIVE